MLSKRGVLPAAVLAAGDIPLSVFAFQTGTAAKNPWKEPVKTVKSSQ